jgi:hypothetical protein
MSCNYKIIANAYSDLVSSTSETIRPIVQNTIQSVEWLTNDQQERLINNLTKCYSRQIAYDTNPQPNLKTSSIKSLWFQSLSKEQAYQLLSALNTLDTELRSRMQVGYSRDLNIFGVGTKELRPMSQNKEALIGACYNLFDGLFNIGIPIIYLVLSGCGLRFDGDRFLNHTIDELGPLYEESPPNIQFQSAFSQFLLFFISVIQSGVLVVRLLALHNWKSAIVLPTSSGALSDFNLARHADDLFGNTTDNSPGLFPMLKQFGVGTFVRTDTNQSSDMTKAILTEIRNGVTAKEFTPSDSFPKGQPFQGFFIVLDTSTSDELPDFTKDARFHVFTTYEATSIPDSITTPRPNKWSEQLKNAVEKNANQRDEFQKSLSDQADSFQKMAQVICDTPYPPQDNPFFSLIGYESYLEKAQKLLNETPWLELRGSYGLGKTDCANAIKRAITPTTHDSNAALPPLVLSTHAGKMRIGSNTPYSYNLFNSAAFSRVAALADALYTMMTVIILVKSIDYHTKNATDNDPYVQSLFSVILVFLGLSVKSANNALIYYQQKNFPTQTKLDAPNQTRFIASTKGLDALTMVAQSSTGPFQSRFANHDRLLFQSDGEGVIRVEDLDLMDSICQHLLMRTIFLKTVPVYPYFYLDHPHNHDIVSVATSNAKPYTVESEYYRDFPEGKHDTIVAMINFHIVQAIRRLDNADTLLENLDSNSDFKSELLKYFYNETHYVLCRQQLKVLDELENITEYTPAIVSKLFHDNIVSQPHLGFLHDALNKLRDNSPSTDRSGY